MVCYFLPLHPGAKKLWGSEAHDFWCCHGTYVQAQAMFEDLIDYRAHDRVTVSQFIPSQATLGSPGHQIRITQKTDTSDSRSNFSRPDDTTRFAIELTVASDKAGPWTLRIRQPSWATGPGAVTVDGKLVPSSVSKNGFLEIEREWTSSQAKVSFYKRVVKEPLPGDDRRCALLDGPVALAALANTEPEFSAKDAITPQYEHQ